LNPPPSVSQDEKAGASRAKRQTEMQHLRSWNKQGERENDPRQKIARMQPGKKVKQIKTQCNNRAKLR
jgi:hypothetical protein